MFDSSSEARALKPSTSSRCWKEECCRIESKCSAPLGTKRYGMSWFVGISICIPAWRKHLVRSLSKRQAVDCMLFALVLAAFRRCSLSTWPLLQSLKKMIWLRWLWRPSPLCGRIRYELKNFMIKWKRCIPGRMLQSGPKEYTMASPECWAKKTFTAIIQAAAGPLLEAELAYRALLSSTGWSAIMAVGFGLENSSACVLWSTIWSYNFWRYGLRGRKSTSPRIGQRRRMLTIKSKKTPGDHCGSEIHGRALLAERIEDININFCIES